jgi:hypothetical protein
MLPRISFNLVTLANGGRAAIGQAGPLRALTCGHGRGYFSSFWDNPGAKTERTTPYRLNAGITASDTHWNWSSITASGVAIGVLRLMSCMPG